MKRLGKIIKTLIGLTAAIITIIYFDAQYDLFNNLWKFISKPKETIIKIDDEKSEKEREKTAALVEDKVAVKVEEKVSSEVKKIGEKLNFVFIVLAVLAAFFVILLSFILFRYFSNRPRRSDAKRKPIDIYLKDEEEDKNRDIEKYLYDDPDEHSDFYS